MRIRKGPYGIFAIKRIKEIDLLDEYTCEIMETDTPEYLVPLYVNDMCTIVEFSYDISNLCPIKDLQAPNTYEEKTEYRNAIGRLFLSLIDRMDELFHIEQFELSEDMLFYDQEEQKLMLCYIPIKNMSKPNKLSQIKESVEVLFESALFENLLSTDEITTMLYAIEMNNEEMFAKTCEAIMTNTENKNNTSRMNLLMLCTLLAFTTLAMEIILKLLPCTILLAATTIFVLISVLRKQNHSLALSKKAKQSPETSSNRKDILFENNYIPNANEEKCDAMSLFSIAYIEETKRSSNNSAEQQTKFCIYSDRSIIGRDRFTSDIHINDESLCLVQAQIDFEGNKYYLTDLSNNNSTYLENRPLIRGEKYEIMNNQLLRFGNYECRFIKA